MLLSTKKIIYIVVNFFYIHLIHTENGENNLYINNIEGKRKEIRILFYKEL